MPSHHWACCLSKSLEVEWYVIKAYKFTVFEGIYCIIIYCVSTLLLRIESTDSMVWVKPVQAVCRERGELLIERWF